MEDRARAAQMTRRALLATAALAGLSASAEAGPRPAYRNASLPIEARVRDLLGRMTLEEKAAQLRCLWTGKSALMDTEGAFSPEKAAAAMPNGIGQIGRPSDLTGLRGRIGGFREPEDAAAFINAVQRFSVERTRLGIPVLFHEEMAHGLAVSGATSFPIPPGLASTWNPTLIQEAYAVAAREARLRGVTVALTPVLDLMREPRWGRMEEFFSEDPYLTGEMALAAVRGLQGASRPLAHEKVFATLKHFVHASPEAGLNTAPAEVSERTLRENYLVPFERVIKAADPAIVMPSYNEIGGVPGHANRALLQDAGRKRMGFQGAYFSDYGAVPQLAALHHMAADADEAAIIALNAGVDADLPEGAAYARLPDLVRQGRVEEAKVDAAVARVLALKFEAGLFETPYVDARRVRRGTATPAAVALARTIAQQSIVLLKNDGMLPLDPAKLKRLAVIGPNAADELLGGYSGRPAHVVSILEGVRAAVGDGVVVEHAEGVWITRPDKEGRRDASSRIFPVSAEDDAARIREAVAVASRADTILLVVGDNAQVTREAVSPPMAGDRNALGLYGRQDELVEAMLATGKPVVALLLNGRPLAVPRLADGVNGLFAGWYLGQEGGHAFADVLFGRETPGGKLTVTFPRSVGELPLFYNRHPSSNQVPYVEGGGKRRSPLFPFGFGLSYTTFEISAPRLAKAEIAIGESVAVEVDVRNTGARAGAEVVQLYIRDEVSSAPRPVLELKGFQRVALKPGESRVVRFDLTPHDLAFWSVDMIWQVEPGTFAVSCGASSDALKSAKLTVRA